MRISPYTLGNLRAIATPRPLDLRVESAAALSDRYPKSPPDIWPAVERVFEGVVLPRAVRSNTVLTDDRTRVLTTQARRVVTPETPPPDLSLTPAPVLFYRLHSSTETLAADPVGRHVNQYA